MTERQRTELLPDALDRAIQLEGRANSPLAPLILHMYRIRRFRRLALALCRRLEAGSLFSATWRKILRDTHGVEIGKYSYGDVLNPGVLPRGTQVGAYCSVGSRLIVRRRDHPFERPIMHPFLYNSVLGFLSEDSIQTIEENPLSIGHDVWIGDRVTILGGCRRVGNGAVLAAGAVVTKDVAPYSVVAGVPAKVLKMRFSPEDIAQLEETRWWERNLPELLRSLREGRIPLSVREF